MVARTEESRSPTEGEAEIRAWFLESVSTMREIDRFRVRILLSATPRGFIRWLENWEDRWTEYHDCFLTVTRRSEGVIHANLEDYDITGPDSVQKIRIAWYQIVQVRSDCSELTSDLLDRNDPYRDYYTRTLEDAISLFGFQTEQQQSLPWQDEGSIETLPQTAEDNTKAVEAAPTARTWEKYSDNPELQRIQEYLDSVRAERPSWFPKKAPTFLIWQEAIPELLDRLAEQRPDAVDSDEPDAKVNYADLADHLKLYVSGWTAGSKRVSQLFTAYNNGWLKLPWETF